MATPRFVLALSILEKLAADMGAMWSLDEKTFAVDAYISDITPEERDLLDSLRCEAEMAN